MATLPDPEATIDMREQLLRMEKMSAETRKLMQETRLATPQMFFQGGLATAALIGAIAAAIKLFG